MNKYFWFVFHVIIKWINLWKVCLHSLRMEGQVLLCGCCWCFRTLVFVTKDSWREELFIEFYILLKQLETQRETNRCSVVSRDFNHQRNLFTTTCIHWKAIYFIHDKLCIHWITWKKVSAHVIFVDTYSVNKRWVSRKYPIPYLKDKYKDLKPITTSPSHPQPILALLRFGFTWSNYA